MISIIITAFKEQKTIERAISAIEEQEIGEHETIVVAPDKETLEAAEKIKKKYKNLVVLKDKGKGKSAALNFAVENGKGDILILTDGDVYVSKNSINELLLKLKKHEIGAVTGKPVSMNPKSNKFGFWAYLLTKTADKRRRKALKEGKRFFCSGYLFAIKKKLFPKLPENLLSEDGFISHMVYEKGNKIEYANKAEVYVKYPNNFEDWINQKRRSAGGYNQIRKMIGVNIRSFRKESSGASDLLSEIKGIKEFFWLVELFISRIYLWLLIYRDINLKAKSREEIWLRVDSTK